MDDFSKKIYFASDLLKNLKKKKRGDFMKFNLEKKENIIWVMSRET